MTMGSMLTSLAEGMALADASGLNQAELLEVLDLGVMSNLLFRLKGPNMLARTYEPAQFPLQHAQKDMRLALALGDTVSQPLVMSAAANEMFKAARIDYGIQDFAAIYEVVRPRGTEALTAVLFDFDGTLGDTETPAMELAFWELAPYLPAVTANNLESHCLPFMQENAGKAFEHMVDMVETARLQSSLPPIAAVRDEGKHNAGVDAQVVAVVDNHRSLFGLPPLAQIVAVEPIQPLLQMQKDETVAMLSKCAMPNPGVLEVLSALKSHGVRFCVATTSGKPRVPVCVDAAGMRPFFRPDQIHSGESDFDPPRFKPEPDVYLRAASAEDRDPTVCIAVEDSGSGVGSASNANVGLIVGYVGATHIPPESKDSHAAMLLAGAKAKNGRGAEVVIADFSDLLPIVLHFDTFLKQGSPNATYKSALRDALGGGGLVQGKFWLPPL